MKKRDTPDLVGLEISVRAALKIKRRGMSADGGAGILGGKSKGGTANVQREEQRQQWAESEINFYLH